MPQGPETTESESCPSLLIGCKLSEVLESEFVVTMTQVSFLLSILNSVNNLPFSLFVPNI